MEVKEKKLENPHAPANPLCNRQSGGDVHNAASVTGKRRKTKVDGRTTRHASYRISQRIRKRIEEIFGWVKVQGGQDKTKFRGRQRVDASFTLALAAYNLVRLPKLLAEMPP